MAKYGYCEGTNKDAPPFTAGNYETCPYCKRLIKVKLNGEFHTHKGLPAPGKRKGTHLTTSHYRTMQREKDATKSIR